MWNRFRIDWKLTMRWGNEEIRIAVIALYKCGMETSAIFEKLQKLEISRCFDDRAIGLFDDTRDVKGI